MTALLNFFPLYCLSQEKDVNSMLNLLLVQMLTVRTLQTTKPNFAEIISSSIQTQLSFRFTFLFLKLLLLLNS